MLTLVEKLAAVLRSKRFACNDEDELQRAVASTLADAGIRFEREVRFGARDRLDFLVHGVAGEAGVALELKVKTDAKSLLRQVLRYAEHARVGAVVVASTTHHALNLPPTANNKPVRVVHLMGW